MTETTTSSDRQRTGRRRRLIGGTAIGAAAVAAMSLGVFTPAQADINPPNAAFEIFYSPDCQGASKIYNKSEHAPQEQFINDRFNLTRFGSAGIGEHVRNNAASIYIGAGYPALYFDDWNRGKRWSAGHCWNFNPDERNRNFGFKFD
jgi:hypothetical protein